MLAHANFPGICAQAIPLASPVLAPEASATRDAASDARPLLPLTVVFRASSAWVPDLACSQQCQAGMCLVPVFGAGIAVVPATSIPNVGSRPAKAVSGAHWRLIGGAWCSFPLV